MIRAPSPTLLKALTSLELGEEWLLQPNQDPHNPNLWSPGIKLGVKENSFIHQNELFGPVLGIMRADNLKHAIQLANGTPYGLTSGIHSLDEREIKEWMENIEAGNCYVNRGITGAIVQRQPFGGCKQSSFGRGSKAGGPNYLMQLAHPEQVSLPNQLDPLPESFNAFSKYTEENHFNFAKQKLFKTSLESYAFNWNHYFSKDHDPSLVIGQDNILRYVPHRLIVFRVQSSDKEIDVLRVIAAAVLCGTPLQISGEHAQITSYMQTDLFKNFQSIRLIIESEEQFIKRIVEENIQRVRLLQTPSQNLQQALALAACNVLQGNVLANGRIELLNYLREVCFSIDYHRYGNLGLRENEVRNQLVTCVNIEM